jgi:hypothetical protein
MSSVTGTDTRTSTKRPDSTFGVYGNSQHGYGVVGLNDIGIAVFGQSGLEGEDPTVVAMVGVQGDSLSGTGVLGTAEGPLGIGVYGYGRTGVKAQGFSAGTGVDGSGDKIGVLGRTANGTGIHGSASGSGTGVRAESANGIGLIADGKGTGLASGVGAQATGSQAAVVASNPGGGTSATLAGTVLAGQFVGDVTVSGTLFCNTMIAVRKMFEIDHPQDPERRILRHATVESPEMKNVYDGVAILDQAGESVVALPAWFEALNGDFRYQLTCLGSHAPVYIAEEIRDNKFRIAGGTASLKVSWMVTGIRRDASARARPLGVEEDKAEGEHGLLLDPAAYGLPADRGIWQHRQPRIAAAAPPASDLPSSEPPAALQERLRRLRKEA